MKTVLIVIAVIIIVGLGVYFVASWNSSTNPSPSISLSNSPVPTPTPSATAKVTASPTSDIRVTAPARNALVTSPLRVTGSARGSWYFEAVFPVKLLDANGREIARTQAQAQGNWMTSNFVPFVATLQFVKPATSTGTLILENDNPSGLPANAKSISIPVRF